jgi:hypothetical protein
VGGSTKVSSVADLTQALESGVEEIEVQGTLSGMPMITLAPGCTPARRDAEVRREWPSADE